MSKKRDRGLQQQDEGGRTKKARREYTQEDAQLAQIFASLASDEASARKEATIRLLSHTEHAEGEALEKIQTRLVRGLCSNRKSARLGFYVALTEIWRTTFSSGKSKTSSAPISLRGTLVLIEQLTRPEGGASSQEKRDCKLGQLTAYKALIQSEAFFTGSLADQTPDDVINSIFKLATDTSWIREQAGQLLCESLTNATSFKSASGFVEAVLTKLVSNQFAKTPEGLAIWLTAKRIAPDASFPKKIWHHADPLSKKDLVEVSLILKQGQSTEQEVTKGKQSGARQKVPHFAWNVVLANFFDAGDDSTTSNKFATFWNDAVDASFFADGSSSERKSVGFQIFTKALTILPSAALPALFSSRLMTCLVNQSSKSDRFLFHTARGVLEALVTRAKTNPAAASNILQAILTSSGGINFDRLTNMKTIHNLLACLDDEQAAIVTQTLIHKFNGALRSSSDDASPLDIKFVPDLLLQLCKARSVSQDLIEPPVWLKDLSNFLAHHGYVVQDHGKPSSDVQSALQSRLQSCMAHVMSINPNFAARVQASTVKVLSNERVSAIEDASTSLRKTIASSIKLLAKLEKQAATTNIYHTSLLLSSTLLEGLGGSADALALLEELNEALDPKVERNDQTQVSTLVDIILGLVSRQSASHTRLGTQVFIALTPYISSEDLQALLDVLEQKETSAGQQALFEQQDDQNGEIEDEDEDEEDDNDNDSSENSDDESAASDASDVEIAEMDSDVEVVEAEADPSDSSSEDDDDDDDDEEEELKKFDSMLANVLKTSGADAASDSGSESSMDDEQMMALEPHLAAVFRERAAAGVAGGAAPSKRRAKADARQNVVAFKARVLDLLSAFVRAQHANRAVLALLLPLLRLMASTAQRSLAAQAGGVLARLFDVAKGKGIPEDVPRADAQALVAEIHAEARRFASKAHAAACSRASLFVARVLLRGSDVALAKDEVRTQLEWLVDRYATTHKECLREGSGLPASFWSDWVAFSLSIKKD